ncbi:AAA family ATPase [Idiomarina abyssalis]|uniref:AAA family ATPase n=1 Tax=Idiomarina abyssalis TaxID=86102 RepID=UPI003A94A591
MPKLGARSTSSPIKLLVAGDSGAGKTGALESLVRAGYKLKIIDYDNGLDYLQSVLQDKPELLDQIDYASFTNQFKTAAGKVIPKGSPKAWANSLKLLESGKIDGEDWGKPEEWDEDTFLVIDSLTMAAKAAFLQVRQLNNRLMETPHQSDWGEAQGLTEGLIQWICSETIKCNVIVLTHITLIEMQDGILRGYPSTIGKALSTTLPRYFNTILYATTKGAGKTAKRVICPLPQATVETKAAVEVNRLPEHWPIQTAYAEFMQLAKGKLPNPDYKPSVASKNSQSSGGNKPGLTVRK